jgi:hypothetical protein
MLSNIFVCVCVDLLKKNNVPQVYFHTPGKSEILGDSEVHEALHGLTCFQARANGCCPHVFDLAEKRDVVV